MKSQILADSLNNQTGDRITTFLIELWKPVLGELARHRVLSINAESSRARPISKVKQQVSEDPFIPFFTATQKGMQGAEITDYNTYSCAVKGWLKARDRALENVAALEGLNIHKQQVNRILEPWMKVSVMVTGTDWDNFFKLRCHESTQPELRSVAVEMRCLLEDSTPVSLNPGEWHLPYFQTSGDYEFRWQGLYSVQELLYFIVSKSARISYGNHLKDLACEKAKELHDELKNNNHWSCFEHAAMVMSPRDNNKFRNFRGFMHYRQMLEEGLKVS